VPLIREYSNLFCVLNYTNTQTVYDVLNIGILLFDGHLALVLEIRGVHGVRQLAKPDDGKVIQNTILFSETTEH
jgi:hypothetical protein